MRVVILGTGSTIGTFQDTTLGVRGFIERLNKERPGWDRDPQFDEIVRARHDCGDPKDPEGTKDLDKLWRYVDYTAKLHRSLGDRHLYSKISGQLRKALLIAYGLTRETEHLLTTCPDFALKKELGELSAGDAIVSFNWDTVAERVANATRIPLAACRSAPLHYDRVNLVKPHGSLSWEDEERKDPVWDDHGKPRPFPMAIDRVHPPGRSLQPLILGAVPIKVELLAEMQPAGLYALIADQWHAVVDAIARADEMVIVGYSFPPDDDYGHFLFQQGARRRADPNKPPVIRCYTPWAEVGKMTDAIVHIFGGALGSCTFHGPVTNPSWTGCR